MFTNAPKKKEFATHTATTRHFDKFLYMYFINNYPASDGKKISRVKNYQELIWKILARKEP